MDYSILVERAKSGDKSAFDEIYNNCYAFVVFACQSYCESKEDMEEVVQDTFFEAFRNIDKLQKDAVFLTWLKKIATVQCYRKFGKVNKYNKRIVFTGDLTDIEAEFEIEELDKAFLPLDYCEDNEMRAELSNVINALPASQKKMVHLYYYVDLKIEEIAKLHGYTKGYVCKALFTARRTIKENLQKTGTYASFVPLGAFFLAEETAFVAKYVNENTISIAGTGAAIASAAIQGTGVTGAGAVASGTGAGAATAGGVTAKTAVSTYVAITAACVLTTGLIAGGIYYAIFAPDSQNEEIAQTEIGLTDIEQHDYTPSGAFDYEYYEECEQYCHEEYFYDTEAQEGGSNTNQTVNSSQGDVTFASIDDNEEVDTYDPIPLDEEPEPIIDNTSEILRALNNATTASDVTGIINRYGFTRFINAQGSNGETLWFYSVNKGSGDILIGIRNDEWFMKFRFFENSVINMRTTDFVIWMES